MSGGAPAPDEGPLNDGDPEAVPVLLELLRGNSAKARQVAAAGLGLLGVKAKPAEPAILTAHKNACQDCDAEVQVAAKRALRLLEGEPKSGN